MTEMRVNNHIDLPWRLHARNGCSVCVI